MQRAAATFRPAARRSALFAGLAGAIASWGASAQAGARLLKGPYLTGLSDTGVDVRFELDGSAAATVEVGRDGGGGTTKAFEDSAPRAMHSVHLAGLAPSTPYRYVVRSAGAVVGKGTFSTAPTLDAGTPLKFVVYGDNRTDEPAHAAVVRAIASSSAGILLNTGDLVEQGGRARDWQSFFDVEAPILRDRPFFVAVGNHELVDDPSGATFSRYFGPVGASGPQHTYSTARLSRVRFFFLNGSDDWGSGDQRTWLEQELVRADGEPGLVWRIAVVHHGPWSSGPHGPNPKLIAAHVPELLAASDAFVLSSDSEGLPIGLLEAWAAGLPVVSTSVGGISAAVTSGETGLLVAAGDEAALRAALVRVLDGEEALAQMARRGRAHALETYSAEHMADAYLALYDAYRRG